MSIQLKKRILKSIMTLFPATPSETDFSLREIFHTDKYITGSKAYQDEVKLETAKWRYQYENQLAVPMIEKYFPEFDFKSLRGKVLLDVGCYTGGRSIFYKERYGMSKVIGIDIDKVFSEAAYLFTAKKKQTDVEFHVGFAENLPFADNIFDVIITTDVFEHVQDVQKCMLECKRVLKSTGVLLVAFPQYLQPLEAHLGLVTRVNFL
ncbi:MAG: class I SAM-dependent methyltransferase, partial [Bacteriovorax sp.]|nr:class I SAM-dependent methyltransferase [Bacteriovorax sp.]